MQEVSCPYHAYAHDAYILKDNIPNYKHWWYVTMVTDYCGFIVICGKLILDEPQIEI